MDKLLSSVQKNRRHNNKQIKTKNPNKKKQQQQELKVVYISNPVRFSTSAAKFRALVQELTGQDAEDLPGQPMFPAAHDGGGGRGEEGSWQKDVMEDNHHHVLQLPSIHNPGTATSSSSSSENSNLLLEEAYYVPELQENFPAAGMLPSNMWYDL